MSKCLCGHEENAHVEFSSAGANGFYGCLECSYGNCDFFVAVPREAETPTDKRLLDMIEMRDKIIDKMRVERVLLAKLASDTPQFDNPIAAWEAQRIRDEILKETANAD